MKIGPLLVTALNIPYDDVPLVNAIIAIGKGLGLRMSKGEETLVQLKHLNA